MWLRTETQIINESQRQTYLINTLTGVRFCLRMGYDHQAHEYTHPIIAFETGRFNHSNEMMDFIICANLEGLSYDEAFTIFSREFTDEISETMQNALWGGQEMIRKVAIVGEVLTGKP